MGSFESRTEMAKTIGEVSAALFELRDALVELSMSLKDWQFEHDSERRKITENTVQQLLEQMMSSRNPSS
jgi:hypothetical protein